MIVSLYLSFTRYNIFQPPEWIGLDNYIRMFTDDPSFAQSAQITLVYVLVGTPITLAAALVVAMLLNYRDRGAGFFRSSFYAPSLIGASVSVASQSPLAARRSEGRTDCHHHRGGDRPQPVLAHGELDDAEYGGARAAERRDGC